mgnify:CR=1 FL=1
MTPRIAHSLYGRGLAKLKSNDAEGGRVDIALAKDINAEIDKISRAASACNDWRHWNVFARRSCSNKKMTDEHDSSQLKHALVFICDWRLPQHEMSENAEAIGLAGVVLPCLRFEGDDAAALFDDRDPGVAVQRAWVTVTVHKIIVSNDP